MTSVWRPAVIGFWSPRVSPQTRTSAFKMFVQFSFFCPMSNCSQNCWIIWNSVMLCFKRGMNICPVESLLRDRDDIVPLKHDLGQFVCHRNGRYGGCDFITNPCYCNFEVPRVHDSIAQVGSCGRAPGWHRHGGRVPPCLQYSIIVAT